ncbi:MAG: protealysin inhibitor emfourin [Alphaproteobacteria bacterium]
MRISIERSGGVAGIIRRAAVDEATLAPAEARRFRELMGAVDFADLARAKPGKGAPDRFVYAITAEIGGKTLTLTVGEALMPEPLAACIAYAFDHAGG